MDAGTRDEELLSGRGTAGRAPTAVLSFLWWVEAEELEIAGGEGAFDLVGVGGGPRRPWGAGVGAFADGEADGVFAGAGGAEGEGAEDEGEFVAAVGGDGSAKLAGIFVVGWGTVGVDGGAFEGPLRFLVDPAEAAKDDRLVFAFDDHAGAEEGEVDSAVGGVDGAAAGDAASALDDGWAKLGAEGEGGGERRGEGGGGREGLAAG